MLHVPARRFSGSGGLFGSGSSSSSPTSTSDNLFSTDIVELLLGVSEGPILGLTDGAKTFFIGDTPIKNVDGDTNFADFELICRKGTAAGEPIVSRLGGFGSSTEVSTNLASMVPVVRSGLHTGIDYIDIRLVISQLQVVNTSGSFENTGIIKIEYKKASDSDWLPVRTPVTNPLPPETTTTVADIYYGAGSSTLISAAPGDRQIVWTDNAPDTTTANELWFDRDNDHRPQIWSGSSWGDPSGLSWNDDDNYWVWSEVNSWGADHQTRAYVHNAPAPATREQGDFWLDLSNDTAYYYNGATWVLAGSTLFPGSFGAVGTIIGPGELSITGKTTSPFVKELRIPVDNIDDDTYDLRITKISPDSTTETLFDVSWESFQEITAKAYLFPNLATTQLVARASDQFSSIPDFSGVYKGRIVKVPSNYDPEARTYSGVWDGTWKLAYTNNGAYIVNDLVENDRYGLNAYYPVVLNKFDVYDAGVWCDQLTADGTPRFTFNFLLSDPQGCREAIDFIAGTFGARFFDDGNGSARLRIDKYDTAAKLFTKENVTNGLFTYSFTDVTSRYNDITVAFTNPDLNWEEDRRRVADETHIGKYGNIPLNFAAVGCTNAAEAIRRARYKLITGTTETGIVSFKTNRQGLYLDLYEIILVADEDLHLTPSGRVVSVSGARQFEPRDAIYLEAGVDYKVVFQLDTEMAEYTIPTGTSGSLTSIPVTEDLPTLPDHTVFFIQTADDTAIPQPFRVTAISAIEDDPDNVEIQAVQVNRLKWDFIDGTVDAETVSQTDLSLGLKTRPVPAVRIRPFTSVSGSRIVNNVILDWDPSPTKTVNNYKITVSKDNGPAAILGQTPGLSFEWDDIQPGEYLFSVIAVSASGFESAAMMVEQRFVGDYRELEVITNLRLMNESLTNIFTTPSPTFTWTGVSSPDHSDYIVAIFSDTDDLLNTYATSAERFTYERTLNTADGAGRSFKVGVASRNQFGERSAYTVLSVNNPTPAAPSITFAPGLATCTITADVANVVDFAGMKVWISTLTGFDPTTLSPVFEGPVNTFTFHGLADQLYYARVMAYDTFDSTDGTISSQFSFATNGIDADAFDASFQQAIGYITGESDQGLAARLDDLESRIEAIALHNTSGALANYTEHQVISRSINTQGAKFNELITVASSDISALSSQLTELTATVDDNTAAIVSESSARVDGDTALASITDELSTQVGEVSASGMAAFQVGATPTGATARYVVAVRTDVAGVYSEAGMAFDILTDGSTRASVKANSFAILDDSGGVLGSPFFVSSGSAYINNAFINNLTSANILANGITADRLNVSSLDAISATLGNVSVNGSLIVNGTVITGKLATSAVTSMVVTGMNDMHVGSGGNFGTIKSAAIAVTDNASVLIRFTTQQDVPSPNSSNFGTWYITLYRDGAGLIAKAIVYDDNFDGFAILETADSPGNGVHTYSIGLTVSPTGGAANFNLQGMQLVLQQFKR